MSEADTIGPQLPVTGSGRDCGETPATSRLEQLDRRQRQLWLAALFLLILLAAALAVVSRNSIRVLPQYFSALPVGLIVLVVLFGLHAWSKTREIAELRGLVRGIEQRAVAPPTDKQIEQLFALISRSQQTYRDLIDTFDDLFFSLSLEGKIRSVNRSFAAALGRPFHEIIGHRLEEFVDDPNGALRAAAERAMPRFAERRYWSGVIPVRLKKRDPEVAGQPAIRYYECTLHAMVKENRMVGIGGLARDITHQREIEARFTELFETLQEGVYFTAPDGKLLDVNPALARMLGCHSKEELLGTSLESLYLDKADYAAAMAEMEQQGTARSHEVTLRRKDGKPLVCLDTSTIIRDPAGRILRRQGTLLDITARREMEKRLYQEQEFARRLVASFPDLIVVLDTQGRYTYVSPRIKEVLGYQPEELLDKPLGDRTDPEDRQAMLELYNGLVTGKNSYASLEYRAQLKDGGWRYFRATACPLCDSDGRIVGVIASSRDVTEVRRLEQQVAQSEKLAAMGQMLAGVAHELNNPLTAILGVTELLRERVTDETALRQLDLAHRQARRAGDIVQGLLAFARPPAPRKTLLHLSDLLQRTLQLHEHSLRANDITLDFLPRPDLPAVAGDPNQLMQVFVNLITNAEQAIREVRDHGTLRIRLRSFANQVLITFRDDGAGIRPEALSRIFDPFFTTKRPGRGTGLGLSICMAIVREHGGTIEALPVPEGGAVFLISFPVAGEQEVSPAARAPEPARIETPALRGRSILVVDDEESICELVRDGLSARGMVVDCAAEAEEALSFAAAHSYDVVLCDLNLSGSERHSPSGREFLERLWEIVEQRPGILKPVFILMTGGLVDPAILNFRPRIGGVALESPVRALQKPFQISELLALLSEAVENATSPPPGRHSSG